MTWNYRVTMTREPDGVGGEQEVYQIREVYYDDAGKVTSWTVEPVAPLGESWIELADDHARMGRALGLPALDVSGNEAVEMPWRKAAQ